MIIKIPSNQILTINNEKVIKNKISSVEYQNSAVKTSPFDIINYSIPEIYRGDISTAYYNFELIYQDVIEGRYNGHTDETDNFSENMAFDYGILWLELRQEAEFDNSVFSVQNIEPTFKQMVSYVDTIPIGNGVSNVYQKNEPVPVVTIGACDSFDDFQNKCKEIFYKDAKTILGRYINENRFEDLQYLPIEGENQYYYKDIDTNIVYICHPAVGSVTPQTFVPVTYTSSLGDVDPTVKNRIFYGFGYDEAQKKSIVYLFLRPKYDRHNQQGAGFESRSWFYQNFECQLKTKKGEYIFSTNKTAGNKSSNSFKLSNNTFLQDGSFLANKIINQYKNGKETAVIQCTIADYKDTDGNIAISTTDSSKPMIFDIGDVVEPYTYTIYGEQPLSVKIVDGQEIAKHFIVIGTKIIANGAIVQELTLQEYID